MQCPIDGTELAMTERHGVEIDYCPRCRGVWLDRGELDKIIDAAYAMPQGGVQGSSPTAPHDQDPPAIGVWADSIQPTPTQPPPNSPPHQTPPNQAPMNQVPANIPTFGDLLSGLMANQGQRQAGKPRKRKKNRGWLEELFDIDFD